MPKRAVAKSLSVNVMSRGGVRAPRAMTIACMTKVVRALRASGTPRARSAMRSLSKPSFNLSTRALAQLFSAREISVVFVSSTEIRRLNREFRGKDKATDILSFESVEDGSLGELVIALDVIRKQAKEHALTLQDELGYMLLHGVLHLLGFDHGRTMFGIQDQIFEKLRGKF